MVEKLLPAVKDAGKLISSNFTNNKSVSFKGNIDLVTEFDVAVERYLVSELRMLLPGYTIVGEETASTATATDKTIYIDPIDGTTNFVHGFPFVAISIGIYEKGTGVGGIVYNPVLDELFTAEKGAGAFLNGERLSVSPTDSLGNALIATGFPYGIISSDPAPVMRRLQNVLMNTRGVRRAGSAALDLCYTARGVFDGYYEGGLKPWDIAAGMVIVSEAGGVVSGLNGEQHPLSQDIIVASNGLIHNDFMTLLSR